MLTKWLCIERYRETMSGSGLFQGKFLRVRRGCQASQRKADLRGSPGNFRGSPGNFRGSLGNFRGTPGLLLSSTARELPGKSPKNLEKNNFERSSQRGGRQRVRKEGQQGTHLEILLSA